MKWKRGTATYLLTSSRNDSFLSTFLSRLEGDVCATEKSAHPVAWLEHDGEAVREDSGAYRRHAIDDNEMRIELHGALGVRTLRATRQSARFAMCVPHCARTRHRQVTPRD